MWAGQQSPLPTANQFSVLARPVVNLAGLRASPALANGAKLSLVPYPSGVMMRSTVGLQL